MIRKAKHMNGGWQKFITGICTLGAVAAVQAFDAKIVNNGDGSVTLSWPSVLDRQYQVYSNDQLPVSTDNPLGRWQVGDGTEQSLTSSIGANTKQFYSVKERTDFEIDVVSAGYGTVGNSWTYEITDSRENDVPFDAIYTVTDANYVLEDSMEGVTSDWDGVAVIRVIAIDGDGVGSTAHPNVVDWEQELYISKDQSTGLFQVGGVTPESGSDNNDSAGPFTNFGAAPMLMNQFSPGAVVDYDYTHSFWGSVDNTIQHEVVAVPVEVAALIATYDATLSKAIKVTSSFTSEISVGREFPPFGIITYDFEITSIVSDYYVDGVGLVKKEIYLEADPVQNAQSLYEEVTATVVLKSFSLN